MLPPCGIAADAIVYRQAARVPLAVMSGPSALATAFRLLLLGLLLTGFVLKPALAFAEEVHELTAHAADVDHDHGHDDRAPAPDDGKAGHDDDHWHLTHCCGHQPAVLPRLELELLAPVSVSPIPSLAVAFAPALLTAPFRPPITA